MAIEYKYDKSTYCCILINYFYRYRAEFFIHAVISVMYKAGQTARTGKSVDRLR